MHSPWKFELQRDSSATCIQILKSAIHYCVLRVKEMSGMRLVEIYVYVLVPACWIFEHLALR